MISRIPQPLLRSAQDSASRGGSGVELSRSRKQKKINIVTLGCSKNTVDSEKLLQLIEAGGYSVVYDPNDYKADTVIINTCGFINDAKEESIDTIMRFISASRSGKIENLYVMGCLSERYMDALKSEIPEVSRYFGVNSVNEILQELGIKPDKTPSGKRILTGPGHYAYLKVSEGCDRTCAFCAIPAIRGKYTSRPVEDLVSEADYLAGNGVRELILVAQDLCYYGIDLYGKQMLVKLVSELLKISAFEWIRLHYLYPANFPMDLIPLIRENPRVCRYIDIPVQHISDKVLNLMRRSHNGRETRQILQTLRDEIPGAAIRTTIIAGHPGETAREYRELRDFISEYRFDRLGIFPYSHEEGTYSWQNYKDNVSERVKQSRVSELMAIQQGISAERNSARTGTIIKVIIDRREGDFYIGRSEFDSPEVDQEVLVNSEYKLNPGNFYDVLITEAREFDLFGIPV